MQIFSPNAPLSPKASIAMLAFRIVVGAAFIFHGMPKIMAPFTWMTDMMGMDIPNVMQAIAAVAEFGGGLALLFGFLTPLAAFGILVTMVGALFMVHFPQGHVFISMAQPSFELPLMYAISAFLVMMVGPGTYSIDAMMTKGEGAHYAHPATAS